MNRQIVNSDSDRCITFQTRTRLGTREYYGLKYSDAYEVYGLTRTGCCGCAISSKAVADLEKIRPYEPNLVKAAWNVFGDSYRYRLAYNQYKAERAAREKREKTNGFLPE